MPRILTYNVHRCVGTDRKLDVGRVADAIAEYEPDIVALQELDVLRLRTGMVDQAHEIARRLEMAFHFHPAMYIEEELYGDAILTLYPERLVQAAPLPFYGNLGPVVEPRGALWIKVDIGGTWVNVINTHLGLVPREQQIQARALAGEGWIKHPLCSGPTILLGDFNATAGSVVCRTLLKELRDSRQLAPRPHAASSTYPSKLPILRIDHVFVSEGIEITGVMAPFNARTRVASDHLPLIVDFEVTG
jgi:endonuclease/exonuclease/phosphatase family metal-dependent hydrolase